MPFVRSLIALLLAVASFALIQQFLHLQTWVSAEEQAQCLVRLPTADEVKAYGASYVEREIRGRYRREELDRLHVKIFIIDSREESDRP